MALSSLRYRPDHATAAPIETKSGSYIYGGSVAHFHEWELRAEMRMAEALASSGNGKGDGDNQDKVASAVNRIVEGLRGDAFGVAMDIGKETLLTKEGISRLMKMFRSSLFPI